MSKSILLIGGGGHCASVADSLLRTKCYDRIGIVDPQLVAPLFDSIPVLGSDNDLPDLKKSGWTDAFVTLGSVGDSSKRETIYRMVKKMGFMLPDIIDPSAVVSDYCTLDDAVYIGKNAVINAGAIIGKCAIINTSAVVEHNVSVGDFTHISPSATICGDCNIGGSSHIGAGAVIIQGIKVGEHTIVGAGAVVIHDVASGGKVVGNPGKNI